MKTTASLSKLRTSLKKNPIIASQFSLCVSLNMSKSAFSMGFTRCTTRLTTESILCGSLRIDFNSGPKMLLNCWIICSNTRNKTFLFHHGTRGVVIYIGRPLKTTSIIETSFSIISKKERGAQDGEITSATVDMSWQTDAM